MNTLRKGIEVDDRSIIFDKDNMAEYITVRTDEVPRWYRIIHNTSGAYIIIEGKRYYILVNEE